MSGFMRGRLDHRFLPENLARFAAHGEHREIMILRRRIIVMSAGADETRLDFLAERDRRGQKDAIAPDDRRRMALAWQRDLPANVLGLAPFDGRLSIGRYAGA